MAISTQSRVWTYRMAPTKMTMLGSCSNLICLSSVHGTTRLPLHSTTRRSSFWVATMVSTKMMSSSSILSRMKWLKLQEATPMIQPSTPIPTSLFSLLMTRLPGLSEGTVTANRVLSSGRKAMTESRWSEILTLWLPQLLSTRPYKLKLRLMLMIEMKNTFEGYVKTDMTDKI